LVRIHDFRINKNGLFWPENRTSGHRASNMHAAVGGRLHLKICRPRRIATELSRRAAGAPGAHFTAA